MRGPDRFRKPMAKEGPDKKCKVESEKKLEAHENVVVEAQEASQVRGISR